MSERVINDPTVAGWEFDPDTGYWMWVGASEIPDGGGLWEQNGDDIYYDEGNVGIGAQSAGRKLHIEGDGSSNSSIELKRTGSLPKNGRIGADYIGTWSDNSFNIYTNVDADGSAPRLTIDSTGDASFSGTVDAAGFTVNGVPISGGSGGAFDLGSLDLPVGSVASTELMKVSNANEQRIDLKTIRNSGTDWMGTETRLQWRVDASDLAYIGFKNGYGAVFGWGDVELATINQDGVVTAVDFVATSDERAKDNITTAPVGLIDSLKGREWEWKKSGEKGSGVVAQELEQVLPHLVHEDDEGMKSVSYMGLCAYLIEELKDCRERLAVLEAKE